MIRAHESPIIGNWYADLDHTENTFEIVAEDEEAGNIEIQYFSGEIEELDMETWYGMHIAAIPPPKDWSGPFEIDKDEFLDQTDETIHPINWSGPFNNID